MKQGLSSILGGGRDSGGLFGDGSGGIAGGLGSLFGGFFAGGGTVKPGKTHVVGDGGEPELFIPNTVASIVPFSKLQDSSAGGNNIVVNMNIQTPDLASFNHSKGQIAADMARQITRAQRNL